MIVLIDNYDSFTFNLAQQVERLASEPVEVVRNDAFDPETLLAGRPSAIVVSPGPGRPATSGRIVELIRRNESVPLFGVCLGHQAIGEAFGGDVVRAPQPVHGKLSPVKHGARRLFEGCPNPLFTTRYHSLVVDRASLPPELEIDAQTEDGIIMALSHAARPVYGVQFHPESYGTDGGDDIVSNFLRLAGVARAGKRRPSGGLIIQHAIRRVIEGVDLSPDEMQEVFGEMMDGAATEAQKSAFLVALRMKGETPEELTGAARAMRQRVSPLRVELPNLIDTCGTGGDGRSTFNVSTVAAIVAAGAGALVAKHGNRAVSSSSGSADVLAALGVHLDLDAARTATVLERIGIAFLFAPKLHPAMGAVVDVRRQLGVRTIFNLLGPLTNPAMARRQVMGVYAPQLVPVIARVLQALGSEHALVVHSEDGLDEISVSAPTLVAEVRHGEIREYVVKPEDFGLARHELDDVRGGDAKANAASAREVLRGRKGATRDIVLLNAGAAIYVSGLAPTLDKGVELAALSIDSGAALRKLDELVAVTREVGEVA